MNPFVMNLFDDPDGQVLINDDEQPSLWPSWLTVSAGWRVVHAEDILAGAREAAVAGQLARPVPSTRDDTDSPLATT